MDEWKEISKAKLHRTYQGAGCANGRLMWCVFEFDDKRQPIYDGVWLWVDRRWRKADVSDIRADLSLFAEIKHPFYL